MSPSLNKVLARLWPDPRARLGVALMRQSVCAVRVHASAAGSHGVDWIRHQDLPFRLFEGIPPPDAVHRLTGAFSELCAAARKSYLPVHIALADPAVSLRVFELDDVPKSRIARARLAQWLLEKELGLRDVTCVHQYLGKQDQRHLLLASAVDRRWFTVVRDAWRAAGIVPHLVDAAISLMVDRFYVQLARAEGATGLVTLEPESWTLALLDGQKRLRYVRSRWRKDSSKENSSDHEEIVDEVERTIVAFSHGVSQRNIKTVYLTGAATDLAGFSAALDARMQTPSIALAVDSGFRRGALDEENIPSAAALAGAMSR